MASVLRDGGLLVLTSRNWELVRAEGSRLQVADQLVERGGERALIIHAWTISDSWQDRHFVDIAVARLDSGGGVEAQRQRLSFWPFRHEELDDDVRAVGLEPESTTYTDDVERYLVTARRHILAI